jgi:hypothetical protein
VHGDVHRVLTIFLQRQSFYYASNGGTRQARENHVPHTFEHRMDFHQQASDLQADVLSFDTRIQADAVRHRATASIELCSNYNKTCYIRL